MTPAAPQLGHARMMEDWIVTLTPIPDLAAVLGRGPRRRAQAQLRQLQEGSRRSHEQAPPHRLEAPALTSPGVVRATLSLEAGPAGNGDVADRYWHLAMSLRADGTRRPAPAGELAAWIAAGWPTLAAVDSYLIADILTARHAHLPA